MNNKKIKISDTLKEEIVRYAISFFFSWLIAALISDFPFFRNIIIAIGLDHWMTNLILFISEHSLNAFGLFTHSQGNIMRITGTPGIRLDYGCLGFRQLAFFIVFVLLQFGRFKHKIWYLLSGIIFLICLNIFRITFVAYSQYIDPNVAQEVHDLASPILMYPSILFLWIFWVVKFGKPTAESFLILPLIKKISSIFRLREK